MGLFTRDLAIDLGTANTVIINNGKIVLDEPSVVAVNTKTEKLIAVGSEAHNMEGRTPPHIQTIRPIRNGVISDFHSAELMIREMIKKANI